MAEAADIAGEVAQGLVRADQARRDTMLVRIAELFSGVSHLLDDGGVDTFDTIFVSLIPVCSEGARTVLADAIAPNPRAPGRAIRHLAFDDAIMVARPVIRLSPLLFDDHLLALATVKSPEHLLAMCERASLAGGVTDIILSRANGEIRMALASNPGARLTARGAAALAEAALDDGGLYDIVQQRPDVAAQLMVLEGASPAPVAAPAPVARPSAIAQPSTIAQPSAVVQPAGQPAPAALPPLPEGVAAFDQLVRETMAKGTVDIALGLLARRIGVPTVAVAKAFALDVHGGFLAYAKAAPLSWDTTLRFLMKRYEAGQVAPRLQRAEADFQRMSVVEARRVSALLGQHGGKPS